MIDLAAQGRSRILGQRLDLGRDLSNAGESTLQGHLVSIRNVLTVPHAPQFGFGVVHCSAQKLHFMDPARLSAQICVIKLVAFSKKAVDCVPHRVFARAIRRVISQIRDERFQQLRRMRAGAVADRREVLPGVSKILALRTRVNDCGPDHRGCCAEHRTGKCKSISGIGATQPLIGTEAQSESSCAGDSHERAIPPTPY